MSANAMRAVSANKSRGVSANKIRDVSANTITPDKIQGSSQSITSSRAELFRATPNQKVMLKDGDDQPVPVISHSLVFSENTRRKPRPVKMLETKAQKRLKIIARFFFKKFGIFEILEFS